VRALMIQGASSDAGKSTLVAGLCRVLRRQGVRVTPFKPQNMSLNSAVTADGGEIGRAQALQAQAAGIAATVDMNPVLLKPESDTHAQVIVHGHAIGRMGAGGYHDYKRIAREAVLASYRRLQANYDIVIVEGAGSPAEINLREGDIANMGFAEAIDCPVALIADIDRGGVFAHLVGTLALLRHAGLSAEQAAQVGGYLLNAVAMLVTREPGREYGPDSEARDDAIRRKTASLSGLPLRRYPSVVSSASVLAACPSPDAYFSLGLDMLIAGVTATAEQGSPAANPA